MIHFLVTFVSSIDVGPANVTPVVVEIPNGRGAVRGHAAEVVLLLLLRKLNDDDDSDNEDSVAMTMSLTMVIVTKMTKINSFSHDHGLVILDYD